MWPNEKSQVRFSFVILLLMLTNCAQSRHTVTQPLHEPEDPLHEKKVTLMKEDVLPEINAAIVVAQALNAKKVAPLSHARAMEKLKSLDAYISVNPEDREEIDAKASAALFEADRLMVITEQSNQIKRMKPEEIALTMQGHLQAIGETIGIRDMRDQNFQTQLGAIVGAINTLKAERTSFAEQADLRKIEMERQAADHQEMIDILHVQVAALEDQSTEDRMAKERMAKEWLAMERRIEAENRFNQRYLKVRSYFQVDEADVFKQEGQLIIRLKAMHFPVGKSTLSEKNDDLLRKVKKSILTFENPRVIVEGHTDSTGIESFNMELSLKRAEAVRQYLVRNDALPAENLSAVGYGANHPLASNLNSAGRAINRRIDVLIIPESKSM